MTSKERVLASINFSQPDRVPVDFSANRWVLEKLYKATGINDYSQLLMHYNADIVDLRGIVNPVYKGPVPYIDVQEDGIRQNFWGWRTRICETATGPEEMYAEFILQNADLTQVENHQWPQVDWFDFTDFSERLKPWSDFAIMASGASIWQHPSFLRSLDQLLMDVALQDEAGIYVIDKFVEFYTNYFDKMFSSAPNQIQILRIADDIGMQDRLIFSPSQFNSFLAPRLRKIVDMAHSHNVKVMFHSCGAVEPLINNIIDIGIDILNPLQITASGMDPDILKQKYGSRICLHGSIDTQYLLPNGTPEDIIENVKKMITILSPDGGFILSPTHILQNDVSVENIEALYFTVKKYGSYESANFV